MRFILIVICLNFQLINIRAVNENEVKATSLHDNHHINKHSLRSSPSNTEFESNINNSSNSKNHECTSEQMKNLDWEYLEIDGFLCGPTSVVNGYSVTMLPKGMYFYHGSETLPHGVIPGGETEGLSITFIVSFRFKLKFMD